jgi:hypothetical protein
MRKPRRRYFYDTSISTPLNPVGYDGRRGYPDSMWNIYDRAPCDFINHMQPADAMNNAQFVVDVYGPKSLDAAIFLNHAVINEVYNIK